MTEKVRHQWIHNMHGRPTIHKAMTALTGLSTKAIEQHEEMRSSRCKRDEVDFSS